MRALAGWRFCPRCATQLDDVGHRIQCPRCGFVHYANPTPAVSALVLDDAGRLLLGRRAYEPEAGLWDALGGFLDEDADAVEGLRRELREEAGVEIDVGPFVGVFTDRYGRAPDAKSVLNLVWEAVIVAGQPSPADDVAELRWFALDALPPEGDLAFTWLADCLHSLTSRKTKGPANRPFG